MHFPSASLPRPRALTLTWVVRKLIHSTLRWLLQESSTLAALQLPLPQCFPLLPCMQKPFKLHLQATRKPRVRFLSASLPRPRALASHLEVVAMRKQSFDLAALQLPLAMCTCQPLRCSLLARSAGRTMMEKNHHPSKAVSSELTGPPPASLSQQLVASSKAKTK